MKLTFIHLLSTSIVLIGFFAFNPHSVYAENLYTLPYPSFMPGNKMYIVAKWWETFKKYWSFGNLAQFAYHLQTADKYLVEADTLLRRQQYRLGLSALDKSDDHFLEASLYLMSAKREGKDVARKSNLYQAAAHVHIELLNELLAKLPKTVDWNEENGFKQNYAVSLQLNKAINSRKTGVTYATGDGSGIFTIPIKR